MGVSVYYGGKLAEGKSVDDLFSYVRKVARDRGFRTREVDELYKFSIPQDMLDNPDIKSISNHHTNKERIIEFAKEARLPTRGRSYEELFSLLNSTKFRQVGIYLWLYERAEPLRFLFVEGDNQLTELSQDWWHDRYIKVVGFQRDSLATKTGYEHGEVGVKNHREVLKLLKEVNKLFFNGKLYIQDEERVISPKQH